MERWPLAAKDSDENLVLTSDAGGVLVGDVAGICGTIIPNGYGDGETEVLIYTDPKRVNLHQLEYWGILRGEWKVYEYDCAELSPATEGSLVVAGKTEAYYGEGTVVLIAGEHEWR